MPRVVIERTGEVPADHDAAEKCIMDKASWVGRRVRELAATDPPHLVEADTTLTMSEPDAGVQRYVVRAVMNTEKGMRLIVKVGT